MKEQKHKKHGHRSTSPALRRKKAKANLKESEERLHLLSKVDEGIAIHDKGVVVSANQQAAAMFGYEPSEMIGMHARKLSIPESWKVIRDHFSNEGHEKRYKFVGVKKDGSTFICSIVDKPHHHHGRNLRIATLRDITERRKTEEQHRNILENIQEGYFEVDLAGNYTFLNNSMCRIHGYPKEELLGMNNRQYSEQEVAKKVFQAFNGVYKTGKPLKEIDWQITRKDGTKAYIEASVSLMKDVAGKPTGFRGIIRDITERKQTEEELRNFAENLEDANIALRVLMNRRDEDQKEIEEKLQTNINQLVIPYLKKLHQANLDDRNKKYLSVLESNLREVLSPFMRNFRASHKMLTPQEIQIVDLIMKGRNTKEIADMLNASANTIATHRNNIRKKMNLRNSKINLRAYIMSLK